MDYKIILVILSMLNFFLACFFNNDEYDYHGYSLKIMNFAVGCICLIRIVSLK